MGRTILGAVAGLVVAVVTIMLVELAGRFAFPPPPGLNPMVTEDMATIIGMMPLGAMLFVVAAWVIGAFDGGFVAALIATDKGYPRAAAIVPALMVMAGVVAMIVQMPAHPKWMAIAGLLLPIPAALAAAALARKRKRG